MAPSLVGIGRSSHMTVRSAIQSKPPLEDVASGREEVSVSTHPLPTDRGKSPVPGSSLSP